MTDATQTQMARLFRVYLPGALQTDRFTDAAGLLTLANRGLIRRLGTTYRNHGGQTGAGARRGVRVTYQNVTQTDEGRRVVGALVALFSRTRPDAD